MNNPFLYQDDTMFALWMNAYIHLNVVGQGDLYLETEKGQKIVTEKGERLLVQSRAKSRIDEITNIKMKRDVLSVWITANDAYLYCGRKLKIYTDKLIKP